MAAEEIAQLETQIFELTQKLNALRKARPPEEIPNYTFTTLNGPNTLLDLFGDQQRLLVIHNMGQGCRFCTLWADGFNGLLSHLESAMAVVLVSRDDPQLQRRFANSRDWRFRLASHGGGDYIQEQSVVPGAANMPGAVIYERQGEKIYRKNACVFGPGDLYCSMWNLLALAGIGEAEWVPQFRYWQQPETLDDGGEGVID
jgi:predicted dithiol-disulfide oxidoreductase (DUF899 family)